MSDADWLVLVVEDEAPIRRFLKAALGAQRFKLVEAATGAEAIAMAASHTPDIILLDLGLPDIDGLEVIRRIREWTNTPIIVISARGKDTEKVEGLDAGADDYLAKPFSVEELSARMRVAIRHLTQSRVGKEGPVFQTGDLKVDLARRMVWVAGQEIHLTPIEFKLLAVLVRHSGKVTTQRQLLQEVWGHSSEEQAHYLRNYIHHLRHKLEADPARPVYLSTEPGVGYRLRYQE
ncbi:MAG: response regulator [Deltaproteobacteria bacterium]|nr:response regulator [Deltaproteobacteria bacterium]